VPEEAAVVVKLLVELLPVMVVMGNNLVVALGVAEELTLTDRPAEQVVLVEMGSSL